MLWGGVVTLGGSVFAVKLGVSVGLGLCSLCMAPISSSFGYLARIRSSFSLSRLADFVRLGQSRIWLFCIWLVLLKDQKSDTWYAREIVVDARRRDIISCRK